MPTQIHVIERAGHIHPIEGDMLESGFWAVTSELASALVGGHIYFHKKQKEPSFFGGKIIGYRVETTGEHIGRVVFRFKSTREHRNVSAGSGGWSYEKKIV